jgi:dTDP-glucose pyrophosphorylase
MNIIITMAGLGKRFRDAGYNVPKYRIMAHGKTLFTWSMLSLLNFWRAGARAVFVVQRADNAKEFIEAEAKALGISSVSFVEIDGLTDGQATSALLAKDFISNPDEPMAVYNIDTFVHPDHLLPSDIRGDGWIPCFPGEGSAWSFARVDADGWAMEVREKQRISDWATIGFYYFSSFKLYSDIYSDFFGSGTGLEKGERYIAPMYNHLIAQKKPVAIMKLPAQALIPLGTPAELSAFLDSTPPHLEILQA